MYADDIVAIVQNRAEAIKVIQAMEQISKELELNINKTKSGVMIIDQTLPHQHQQELLGIPYVN